MDLVLINLISAGIAKLGPHLIGDDRQWPRDLQPGEGLIRNAVACVPEATNALIANIVKDIWASCQAVGIPPDIAEPHLAELTRVLSAEFKSEWSGLLLDGSEAGQPADVAVRLVEVEDWSDKAGIDATILGYLATKLFESFRAAVDDLRIISEALSEPVDEEGADEEPVIEKAGPSKADLMLAKIERADALGISVELLEVITVMLINRTKTADLAHADLVGTAEQARAIEASLTELQQRWPGEDFRQALSQFRSGRFMQCDRALTGIEEQTVGRAILNTADANTPLAVDIRRIRAELQIMQGAHVRAARHFGYAQRHLPRTAGEAHWQLAELEAHHYELAGYQGGNPAHLDQAARACTSAIALIDPSKAAALHATAQIKVAWLLIILGERDFSPERFEIAAQFLKDAQDTFADQGSTRAEAAAMMMRAWALTRLGELEGKPDLVEQAAWLLQPALELPTMNETASEEVDPLPDLEMDIELHLALSVASFAELQDNHDLLRSAATTIRLRMLDDPSDLAGAGYLSDLLVVRCARLLGHCAQVEGRRAAANDYLDKAIDAYCTSGFDNGAEASAASRLPEESAASAA